MLTLTVATVYITVNTQHNITSYVSRPSLLPTKLNNMTAGLDLPTVENASTGDETPTRDRAMGRNFMVVDFVMAHAQ